MNTLKQNKIFFFAVIWVGLVLGIYLTYTNRSVLGNALFATDVCQTASATTTVTYMTAGTATTTLSCDLFDLANTGRKDGWLPDTVSLGIQLAGSSTASVLRIDVQESRNNVDWYQRNLSTNLDSIATTTGTLMHTQALTFNFASSTTNRVAMTNANSATSSAKFFFKPTSRYVRFVFYLDPASEGAAFWAEAMAIKQKAN